MKHVISLRFSLPTNLKKQEFRSAVRKYIKQQNEKAKQDNARIITNQYSLLNLTPMIQLLDIKYIDNEIIRAFSGTPDVIIDISLQFESKYQEKKALERFEEDMKEWRKGKSIHKPTSYTDLMYSNMFQEFSENFQKAVATQLNLKYQTMTIYSL